MADDDKKTDTQNTKPVKTTWHNVFDADRPMADISPLRWFTDHKARSNWTVNVAALGASSTTNVQGVLEGSLDHWNFAPILTFNWTGPTPGQFTAQGPSYVAFRVHTTSFTPGGAVGYRVGVAASQS